VSVRLYEKVTSRELSRTVTSAGITLEYVALGSLDESAVYAAAVLGSPNVAYGLRKQKIACKHVGGGLWDVTVEYGFSATTQGDSPDGVPAADDLTAVGPERTIDITAGQVHITQSLATRSKTGRIGVIPPDYKQAVGVTTDRIEGTDIYAPHFEFTVTQQVYPFTRPLMRLVRQMCATVNVYAWDGWEAEEVLYLGASGRAGPDLVWTLTHKFAAGVNLTSVAVSPLLTVASKKAWDYLWCVYDQGTDADRVVTTPRAAYVERVYRATDFSLLGLGA
jgi:hypothetical protein